VEKLKKIAAGVFLLASIALVSCASGAKSVAVAFKSSYDVVVIGAGGAGLSAAIAAKEAGANVAVFEKMAFAGGNTTRATGGLNACGTPYQEALGIKDSVELFFSDTMKGGYNKNNPDLVRNLAEKSASSVAWLSAMGGDLSDVGRMAGASVNRTHRPAGGAAVGPNVMMTLDKQAEQVLGIPVYTETKVTGIIAQGGRVTGIEVSYAGKAHKVSAKAVVLASGGFGANNEMAVSYVPSLKGFATTNQPGATGDGIGLAEKIGADFVDMAEIQTHPTYAPGKEMITEAVRGNGAILVNKNGARFVDELQTRDVVSAAILAQDGKISYLVFDDSVRKSLSAIESYVKMKIVLEAPGPEALAGQIGADPAAFAATIGKYNQAVASKTDAEFGRADMPRALSAAPYYAIEVLPAVHHTMGGVKIDTETRVISKSGQAIPGFYAAGEVTGGVHGGNRLGGNALADIVTYGRIAGTNAAAGR
jgi:fumarate reductase flavoprotein subunit